jgi:radical SAM protein with 4Fe4S-binding SPASM domain
MITLSGGEPLLRKDWRQLALKVKERRLRLFLITNGLAITPEIVDDFKYLGFENIGVSFDGTRETHNYIRQNEKSYDAAVNSMKLMNHAGMPFCAVSQISNINLNELDQMRQILIDAGCKLWRIQMTTSTGRMRKDLVLSLDNYPVLVDKILEFQKQNTIDIDVGENIGYFGRKGTELLEGAPYLGCYAGTRVIGISSNGNIKGCLSMPEEYVEGNVRERSLADIWNDPDAFAYNRQFTRDTATGACHECRYLPLCRGGCTTTSVSASGCRADNPYCMYQIESKQGIKPVDTPAVMALLSRFEECREPKLQ